MTRDELQALRPGDAVEFRDLSNWGAVRYKPATVVRVEGLRVRLRLANGMEILRAQQNLKKEIVKL